VQSGFGLILSMWHADARAHYPVAAWRTAFALALAIQLPGFVCWLLAKRTPRVARREKIGRV
jgi:hypothetical protein